MPRLRAKLWIIKIVRASGFDALSFARVQGTDGNPNGDNTAGANCELSVLSPELLGAFSPGQQFYVDFTEINESRTT